MYEDDPYASGIATEQQKFDIDAAMRRHRGINYKALADAKRSLMAGGIPEDATWRFLRNRATGKTSLGIEDAIIEWNRRNKTVPASNSLSVPSWNRMISVSDPSNQFSATVRRYSALSPSQREYEDQQQAAEVQKVISPIYRQAEIDRNRWNQQLASDRQMMNDRAAKFQQYLQATDQQHQLNEAETRRQNAMLLQRQSREDAYKRVLQSGDMDAIKQFLTANPYR